MQKFNNYVFLSLCEITYKLYKKSHYMTYVNYCKTFNVSIKTNNLDKKETEHLIKIFDYIGKIYGFSDAESFDYLVKFFNLDNLIDFQKCVEADIIANGDIFD